MKTRNRVVPSVVHNCAAHSGAVRVERILCDEEQVPFAEGSFDIVFSSLSLHWVNDLPGVFQKVGDFHLGRVLISIGEVVPAARRCVHWCRAGRFVAERTPVCDKSAYLFLFVNACAFAQLGVCGWGERARGRHQPAHVAAGGRRRCRQHANARGLCAADRRRRHADHHVWLTLFPHARPALHGRVERCRTL